jgi:hypothetical protein
VTSQVIHPRLTPVRRAWLESLATLGVATRGRGRTGYDCMQLGWTKWIWVDRETGARLTADEVRERGYRDIEIIGEELTDAGRAVLAEQP